MDTAYKNQPPSAPLSMLSPLPSHYRHHLNHHPHRLPPLRILDNVEQRSSQSPTTANSPSQSPEPISKRPNSPSPAVSNSPPATSSPTTTIIPPPSLKRPRSPSFYSRSATISSEPPSKMSRFANAAQPAAADAAAWNHHHMQDRVVLPPLQTAVTAVVDNGLTPSRRTSINSPSTYTSQGSYAFTNTFESQRPQTSSSGMSSPSMSTVPGGSDSHSHGPHPYRRPSLASRSTTSTVVSRTGPTSPLVQDMAPRMQTAYSDPNGMSWNIPPPSASNGAPDSARPSTSSYSTYGDYGTDFSGSLQTNGDGTPQSPSFAFASSGYPNAQQANLYNMPSRSNSNGYALAQAAALASQASPPPSGSSSTTTLIDQSQTHPQTPQEEELAQLRTKVRELEFVNDLVQLRVVELENERQKMHGDVKPSIGPTPNPPVDGDFQSSWDKRTEARIKRFCSLNRAGNALCAWHDSRRERRAYPPRMAPPGTLNCGCTYEEALFEESLSRHKVGSYLPGEMVRMDPALRNPLLALLKWRYNYKDGDFERDPLNGKWVDGEGEQVWQQKASSGSAGSSRRKQSDSDST